MDGKIKGRFGFGMMRLPKIGDEIDVEQTKKMVDYFIENGFNYFDTAHGYLDKRSELVVKEALTSRYDRESYVLTDKLTYSYFNTEEEIRPLFESQLVRCGVKYFDYYLVHTVNKNNIEHYRKTKAFETVKALKDEGKIRYIGFSFHDQPEFLDEVLTEFPFVDVVQIQFNYLDYEDPAVQSRKCYEVCRKYKKPVIVMEPVKGGNLVNLPEDAKSVFARLGAASPASYAIRFATGFEGMFMVLSGMSDMAQMQDNLSYMKDFRPLDEEERRAVGEVRDILRSMRLIPCTACRYCTDGCPKHISIPDLFSCMNAKVGYHDWSAGFFYREVFTKNNGKASECIGCGKCEKSCPQHLPIRSLLKDVAKEFEQ